MPDATPSFSRKDWGHNFYKSKKKRNDYHDSLKKIKPIEKVKLHLKFASRKKKDHTRHKEANLDYHTSPVSHL